MKRTALLLLALAGCARSGGSGSGEFDRKWAALGKQGIEPAFVESESHGGLLGEVRRAAPAAPHDERIAAPTLFPGALPDGEVVRVIRQNLGAVRGCYALAEREGSGSGKAIVTLDIDAAGTVSRVAVEAPAFAETHLGGCLTATARGWTFPKAGQGPKRFSYPLVFAGG